MKRLLLFLLLIPFVATAQVQNDAAIVTQINNTIRGKTFNAKNHADAFKTIVDSKLNKTITSNTTLLSSGGSFLIDFSGFSGINFQSATITVQGAFVFRGTDTGFYILQGSAITANRTITLPLLTSGDTFVFANFAQTLASKTLTSPVINTQVSGTVTSGGNITTTNFLVGATATQTLSGKTLTSPILNTPRLNTTSTTGYVWTASDALGNGSWQAASGGGITNSAANNELMKSNGTNAVPSGFFSSALGDFDLGTGLAGSVRTISAQGSATNVGLNLLAKNSGTVTLGGGIINLNHLTGSYVQIGSAGSAGTIAGYYPDVLTVRGSNETDNNVNATGLTLQGGDWSTGNNQGTDVLIKPGLKSGSGATGAIYQNGKIALFTTLVSNWQGMENGLFIANRISAPSAGIANGIALHAADVNSSSELFITTESGAEVNLSGLITPFELTGTSLTLTEAHRGKGIYTTSSSPVTITVPAGLALGFNCVIMQDGSGTVSIITSGGATVNGKIATTSPQDRVGLWNYKGTDVYAGM